MSLGVFSLLPRLLLFPACLPVYARLRHAHACCRHAHVARQTIRQPACMGCIVPLNSSDPARAVPVSPCVTLRQNAVAARQAEARRQRRGELSLVISLLLAHNHSLLSRPVVRCLPLSHLSAIVLISLGAIQFRSSSSLTFVIIFFNSCPPLYQRRHFNQHSTPPAHRLV